VRSSSGERSRSRPAPSAPNPFPLLDRLLDEAEHACSTEIPVAEYEALFARGCADPSYATILSAVD